MKEIKIHAEEAKIPAESLSQETRNTREKTAEAISIGPPNGLLLL